MTRPLNFAVKLDIYRRMKNLTISRLAEKVGVNPDRMEKILAGDHEPRGGDIVRIERSLDIVFDPEDFEPSLIEMKK